jgi:hypothetical protein
VLISFVSGFAEIVLLFYKITRDYDPRSVEHKKHWAALKDVKFWLAYFVLALSGALLCILYLSSGIKVDSMFAFHIGLTAPLILAKSIAKSQDFKIEPEKEAQ